MYQNITKYIANPYKQFPRGNQLITFFKKNNEVYKLIIKTTKDKSINYFNSLHISDFDDMQNYINNKR